MRRRERLGSITYWSVAVVLTAFGFIDLIAIGAPFLALGLALLVLGHRRHERAVFVPGIAVVVGFIVGALLLVPLGCTSSVTASASGPLATAPTRCATALWFDYVGTSPYSPPYLPALLSGAIAGVASWWVARRIVARHRVRPSESPTVA